MSYPTAACRLVWLALLAALLAPPASAQSSPDAPAPHADAPRVTLAGHVRDADTGETLIGANVYVPARGQGATTNPYGFFSLRLPAGEQDVVVSYIGYRPQRHALALEADTVLTFRLQPAAEVLEGVEVVAEREAIHEDAQMSLIDVPVAQIQQIPALLGEVDVLKAVQLLPGAQSGTEGASGLYVRGGGPDQNLMLLDGAPIYNASHLFGFFSIFNADALKNVQLVKGGYPARYGGRLSSVLDISMKDGDMHAFGGSGALGLIASRLTLEGPIQRGRSSFIVSGRRTYADLVARPFLPEDELGGYYFYDVNAKVNAQLSPRDRLYASVYKGDDRFYSHNEKELSWGDSYDDFVFGWGNTIGTLRWNRVFSPRLFANAMLLVSDYRLKLDAEYGSDRSDGTRSHYEERYHSRIRDLSARYDFEYAASAAHSLRAGAQLTHHRYDPGVWQSVYENERTREDTTLAPSARTRAVEGQLYVEDDVRLGERVRLQAGVHASAFGVDGRLYGSVEPRVSARVLATRVWAVKASYARMRQYVHLLSNAGLGLPTDLWVPATDRVRPQSAHQFALGVARPFAAFDFSLEGYYKTMDGLIAYREGASFGPFGATDWQDEVVRGTGRAYGVEVLLQRSRGRTSGWIGYTLAWSTRQFDELNGGRRFPYRYDRRHDVSVVLVRELTPRLTLSGTWVYGTGQAVTIPVARVRTPSNDMRWWMDHYDVYGDRNGFRMPAYHRLDVGLDIHFPTRWGGHVLNLGAYNAYNHKNAFFIYIDGDEGDDGERVKEARQLTLFPIVPSISYRFSF